MQQHPREHAERRALPADVPPFRVLDGQPRRAALERQAADADGTLYNVRTSGRHVTLTVSSGPPGRWQTIIRLDAPMAAAAATELISAACYVQQHQAARGRLPEPEVSDSSFGAFRAAGGEVPR